MQTDTDRTLTLIDDDDVRQQVHETARALSAAFPDDSPDEVLERVRNWLAFARVMQGGRA